MIFTAQLGTADSELGSLVLGWAPLTLTLTAPDQAPVWAPLWLVEVA